MKKSEQVIYITLIDFLIQLLFLGLVLWVITGFSDHEQVDLLGSPGKDAKVLLLVKDLMGKYPGSEPDELLNELTDVVDSVGGINQAADFTKTLKDLMDKTNIKDTNELIKTLKAINEAGGSNQVQAILDKINRMGGGAGKADIDKLLDELAKLKPLQPDIDALGGIANNIELANKAKAIIDKTGISDPVILAELVNKAKKIDAIANKTDAPPHIILSETQGFFFDSGSSKLSLEFREKLENDVVAHIQLAIEKYGINLIEVIGHTDGQPVKRGSKQMDSALESMAVQPYDPNRIPNAVQGSNTDLGLLRALEVVKLLKHLCNQGKLKPINSDTGFRAYSSGQLTLPDGRLSNGQSRKEEPDRRRIEIRLTRLGDRI